jgi:hypothetical protein
MGAGWVDGLRAQREQVAALNGQRADGLPVTPGAHAVVVAGWWKSHAEKYSDWSADGPASCWKCSIGDYLERMEEATTGQVFGIDVPLSEERLNAPLSDEATRDLWESARVIALKLDAQRALEGDWNSFGDALASQAAGVFKTVGQAAAATTVGAARVAGQGAGALLLGVVRGLGPLGIALVVAVVVGLVRK